VLAFSTIGSRRNRVQPRTVNQDAAHCVLKNINKAHSHAAALVVLESTAPRAMN
jgi:hypothetical protein